VGRLAAVVALARRVIAWHFPLSTTTVKLPALPDPTTHILWERVRRLYGHLPKALAGGEEHVHQMRVAARRLRVALPLLAQKPDGRRVRRTLRILRALTRGAGGSRDLDVAVGLFDRHHARHPPTPEARVLRRRLMAARSRSRRHMAEALLDLEIAGLRRDIRVLLARGGDLLFAAASRLRDVRDEQGGWILAELARLGEEYDAPALHRVRIRVRRLRYAAEVADDLRGQPSEAPGRLQDLQEMLGQIRDPFVLSSWLARQAASAASRGQTPLAAEAQSLSGHFDAESRKRHRELLAADPAAAVREAVAALSSGRTSAA
jgi:CHAD domain-containing protein